MTVVAQEHQCDSINESSSTKQAKKYKMSAPVEVWLIEVRFFYKPRIFLSVWVPHWHMDPSAKVVSAPVNIWDLSDLTSANGFSTEASLLQRSRFCWGGITIHVIMVNDLEVILISKIISSGLELDQ
ncbi:hypothetical protein RND71_026296 [Anisodus tanguticus]|uniref:Uncharacterized protein n=1 Tax=Anisodus tanguticus TaxID=243964 RepID=A0AAE1RN70_9SOLA|nr:hypothetical protein RND71_026296 [Anisodus tanguticus]